MQRVPPAAIAGAAAILFGLVSPTAAERLQPHRAVYDISLGETEPSASVTSASGRLVFELSGNACEGYVVNSRFVTEVADREGGLRVTDLRSSTFETVSPATFRFLNETYVDDVLASEVKGRAEGRAGGLEVVLTEPKDTTLDLGRAMFPTAHTLLILDAAREGDRVLEATVFDGGDNADTLFATTTFIGPERTGLPGASDAERDALQAVDGVEDVPLWRLVISYFEQNDDAGERVPDYELTFTMLDNGISYDVMFDYGDFTMTGALAELELMEAPDC
jgi:hypothetical protein